MVIKPVIASVNDNEQLEKSYNPLRVQYPTVEEPVVKVTFPLGAPTYEK